MGFQCILIKGIIRADITEGVIERTCYVPGTYINTYEMGVIVPTLQMKNLRPRVING